MPITPLILSQPYWLPFYSADVLGTLLSLHQLFCLLECSFPRFPHFLQVMAYNATFSVILPDSPVKISIFFSAHMISFFVVIIFFPCSTFHFLTSKRNVLPVKPATRDPGVIIYKTCLLVKSRL